MTEYWKEIFAEIPVPCVVLEPEENRVFRILDANEAYCELTGTRPQDLYKKSSEEAFPANPQQPDHGHHKLLESLNKVMESAEKDVLECFRYDIPIWGTDQFEERYWNTQNIPLRDENGRVKLILHTIRDITLETLFEKKEKEIQEELSINRQQYKNFIRENPDGLYRLDLKGKILHSNEGLATLADIPLEEIIGMDLLPFFAPHHKEMVRTHFLKATRGSITSFEADFISSQGAARVLRVLLMPMHLEGKVTEVHGIAKDVSGLRESEKVIVEKSRFLEVNAAFISSLLENDLDDKALHETFAIIAKTVEADRMYYFGADKDPETGEILISQKVEWCSDRASVQLDNPELQNMPIKRVEEITAPLTRNLPFSAVLSELSEGQMKQIFIEQEIKSMLLLPIFVEEQLFGFVGFDDCKKERCWKNEEVTFLQSLTHNLTNAFEKEIALDKVKKREEELILSEQKFRALVQEGSDLIGILDLEGNYSFLSENYKSVLGLEPSELIGKNASQFIHPEDWERVREQFLALENTKQVKISPFRFRNSKGDYRWVQTTATNLLNDTAVNGIVANSRDITTIVEQAREIEHINERYQLAATATQDLIYDWDLEKDEVTRFHRSSREFFGYPSEVVTKRNFWRDHIHPDDLLVEKRKLAYIFEDPSENHIKTEYRFRRADGTYAQVVDKGYIIRDANGKPKRLIGATSDISDINAKKEALKIANKRFKMAMKATNEMIWDWDIATDSVTRSKGYKNIFGYDTNDATSVHSFWLTKVDPKDQEKVVNSLNRAIANKDQEKWKLEYRIIKADGSVAFVNDRGYIIRDNEGKATRMVGAVLDVTHSRKLIRKIKKQNTVLKEIAWEQSHVVRAPLARIKGLLHLLENEYFEDMTREQVLYHIHNSADELDGIIKNIVGKTEEINA
ncbi:PAS domain S-box protein [Salinimicrobium flavum]|uniref:histidine kinase n=1 Tax=Salinimicrobium flavum TaxID=1737065 RepID=A0ABW5IWI6_9FLAO